MWRNSSSSSKRKKEKQNIIIIIMIKTSENNKKNEYVFRNKCCLFTVLSSYPSHSFSVWWKRQNHTHTLIKLFQKVHKTILLGNFKMFLFSLCDREIWQNLWQNLNCMQHTQNANTRAMPIEYENIILSWASFTRQSLPVFLLIKKKKIRN